MSTLQGGEMGGRGVGTEAAGADVVWRRKEGGQGKAEIGRP